MQKTKNERIHTLTEQGVVAILRQIPGDKIVQVAESLVAGGIHALELTIDTEDAFEVIHQLNTHFKGEAIIGAGTVLDDVSAQLSIRSGAEFIVSPIVKKSVIEKTLLHGKISIPGVMTPTEMVLAVSYGADIVKLFPATAQGPAFIKHVKAPLPDIPIIPTGGININNAKDYIAAGAIAIGAGGQLVDRKAIVEEDYEKLTTLARNYVEVVKEARERN